MMEGAKVHQTEGRLEADALQNLAENLPDPPQDLVSFVQNFNDLQQYRQKSSSLLRQLNERPGDASKLKEELSRYVELERKYHRMLIFQNYKEILLNLDKGHMKAVIELKLLLQKIDFLKTCSDV